MEQKLTFGELETMIDTWASELQEYRGIFINQSEEIGRIFWRVGNNDYQISAIGIKLSLLHYMNQQLEKNIENANVMEEDLEKRLIKLENILQALFVNCPVDCARRQIYEMSGKINCQLNNYKNDVQSLNIETSRYDRKKLKNPVQQVANIMMALLETMEYIEMKMEQMKSRIHWIDRERARIFCRL